MWKLWTTKCKSILVNAFPKWANANTAQSDGKHWKSVIFRELHDLFWEIRLWNSYGIFEMITYVTLQQPITYEMMQILQNPEI